MGNSEVPSSREAPLRIKGALTSMHLRPLVAVAAVSTLALLFVGAAVAESPNVYTNAPITGNAIVGQQLTVHNGTWLYNDGSSCKSECSYTYQWERCTADGASCTNIGGAVGRFYTVQGADAGSRVRAMETVTKNDCNAHGVDCRDVSKSAPSVMTGVVPGSAPNPPSSGPAPPAPAVPAPQAPIVPAATSAPAVAGLAMVEETLTATRGVWSGSPSVALQWQRCDAQGQGCADLGLSGDTYTVIPFDVGKTLRVRATASTGAGAREVVSAPTAVVSELRPTPQKPSIPAVKVIAPHKLVVDELTAQPTRLSSRRSVTVRLRVSDDRGFRITGALVTAVVLPTSALVVPAEASTAEDGTVSLVFAPAAKLNVKKRGAITFVIGARRPGDKLTSPRAAIVRLKVPVLRAKAVSGE
jgi:hypothetical protein